MNIARDVTALVERALRPLRSRLNAMVSRAVLDALTDSEGVQKLKVLGFADEVLSDVDHLLPSGFTCRAVKGAEGVVLCIGGWRDNPVGLGFQKRGLRPALAADGECALYLATGVPAVDGVKVLIKANGDVEIGGGPTDYAALAAKVLTELQAIKTWADAHTHTCAAPASPSSPPVVPMTAPASVAATKTKVR